jgi:hypothetical protein
VIGGTAGAMAGDAAVETPRERTDKIEGDRRDRTERDRRR